MADEFREWSWTQSKDALQRWDVVWMDWIKVRKAKYRKSICHRSFSARIPFKNEITCLEEFFLVNLKIIIFIEHQKSHVERIMWFWSGKLFYESNNICPGPTPPPPKAKTKKIKGATGHLLKFVEGFFFENFGEWKFPKIFSGGSWKFFCQRVWIYQQKILYT